jgi:hypothetical protein
MTKPIIRIHNLETDEIIDREMNDDEFEKYQAEAEAQALIEAQAAAKAAAKAAAEAKLESLGLTKEDLEALGL